MDDLVLKEAGGVQDTLTASKNSEGVICLEIDNPWSGDSVSGIGRSTAFTLTKEQARELAVWALLACHSTT